MKLILTFLFSILLFNCNSNRADHRYVELFKKSDFVYLNKDQSYNFINNYYLKRLDSLETGRKIFIHPINKPDFTSKINVDTTKITIRPPEQIMEDTTFTWNIKRLNNVIIISKNDINDLEKYKKQELAYSEQWKKKFGSGFVYISRPAFNSHSKRIIIREWIENNNFCGTDREKTLLYKLNKDGKWQIE